MIIVKHTIRIKHVVFYANKITKEIIPMLTRISPTANLSFTVVNADG
jgi:hypothetical protein